jgi:hypothetical protein
VRSAERFREGHAYDGTPDNSFDCGIRGNEVETEVQRDSCSCRMFWGLKGKFGLFTPTSIIYLEVHCQKTEIWMYFEHNRFLTRPLSTIDRLCGQSECRALKFSTGT